MKFPIKIPKGWRRLRIGEIVPSDYKYYDIGLKSVLDGHQRHFNTRNTYSSNLRIIPKNK